MSWRIVLAPTGIASCSERTWSTRSKSSSLDRSSRVSVASSIDWATDNVA